MFTLAGFTGGGRLFHRRLILEGEVDGVRLVAGLPLLLRAVEGYVGLPIREAARLLARLRLNLGHKLLAHQVVRVEFDLALGPRLAVETGEEAI